MFSSHTSFSLPCMFESVTQLANGFFSPIMHCRAPLAQVFFFFFFLPFHRQQLRLVDFLMLPQQHSIYSVIALGVIAVHIPYLSHLLFSSCSGIKSKARTRTAGFCEDQPWPLPLLMPLHVLFLSFYFLENMDSHPA